MVVIAKTLRRVCLIDANVVDTGASSGTVVLLGNARALDGVDWTPLWLKELTLRGSLAYGGHAHGGAGRDDKFRVCGPGQSDRAIGDRTARMLQSRKPMHRVDLVTHPLTGQSGGVRPE